MLDYLIKSGTIIDGSGRDGVLADVGIKDGRIAAIGNIDTAAKITIDANGQVVAPGFIDIHTHYDAQVMWDGLLSPSPLHGITSVIGGNCGFSLAPLSPESQDYLMRMMAEVEAIPLSSLQQGAKWDWQSFAEYLQRIDGRIAVNAGFLVGHSTLRRTVLGSEFDRPATPSQIVQLQEALAQALREGALGFSSSYSPTHMDGNLNPVPSRFATREELLALCKTTGEHPGTGLEFIPSVQTFGDVEKEIMTAMSLAANRPLNWNVLAIYAATKENAAQQISASDYAAERGAKVLALTPPMLMTVRINLESGFLFSSLPHWRDTMRLPVPERMRALRNPELRRQLDAGARSDEAGLLRALSAWDKMIVLETFCPEHQAFNGKTIGELAQQAGCNPFDFMLDLAIAEDLRTSFMPGATGDDDESWRLRAEYWHDERTLLGASDAGAHVDMIDTFMYPTVLLGEMVRERKLISLARAIREMTDVPARLYGLKERGRLQVGWHADMVIFNPLTIAPEKAATRRDLPGGIGRLYAGAEGINHVFVNGAEIVRHGEYTGALPGTVLRSGTDTETVSL